MLRRTICRATSLSGNGVLGIRIEDKNNWERRVPLSPNQVAQLIRNKVVDKVVVQPSAIRCFSDADYEASGAQINADLTECGTIVAVKEVPARLLLPDRTYMFFSHTIKAQPYNMPLLDTILSKNIRLLDYERIVGPDGRLVKFGPYAGYAGLIDTLHALGQALLAKGYASPFLHVSLAKEYRSLETARKDLQCTGDIIREKGIPRAVAPLVFAITGSGSVSLAVQQMLHLLPCKYVEVEDLPKLASRERKDQHSIYVCIVRAKDMVVPKDSSQRYSREDYYKNPDKYVPVFHEKVAPYCQVLINGMYWENRFPRILTTAQAQQLSKDKRLPLLCLGEITCDVGGSVEFFTKATTIQNPLYAYDVDKQQDIDLDKYDGTGILILGVDHLPAEFPCEASTDFGAGLSALIGAVCRSRADVDLENQRKALGEPLFKSMVTLNGSLTPNFSYISKLRLQAESSTEKPARILVLGSGMCAGPCVQELLSNPKNSVTLVDASQRALDHVARHFAVGHNPDRSTQLKNQLRCATADLSTVDTFIDSLIGQSDVVVSLLPATMHHMVAAATIAHKVPMITASYLSPAMLNLAGSVAASGVPILNEMGLDPGIDIMTSMKLINEIKANGGVVKKYISLCGALPQPENSNCPMGYKFSWSPRGVLSAASRPARFRMANQWIDVPGRHLFHLIQEVTSFRGLDLWWVPNGDSERYAKLYGLEDAETNCVVRGTLRYASFAPMVRGLLALGVLSETTIPELKLTDTSNFLTWASLIRKLTGNDGSSAPLVNSVAKFLAAALTKDRSEAFASVAFQALASTNTMSPRATAPPSIDDDVSVIISNMTSLGLLSEVEMVPKTASGFPLDSVCEAIAPQLQYKSHERDFVLMIHRITAHYAASNETMTHVATMARRGDSSVHTATGITVGVPLAIGTQLILDGGLKAGGLVLPTDNRVYEPVLRSLKEKGIEMHETVEREIA